MPPAKVTAAINERLEWYCWSRQSYLLALKWKRKYMTSCWKSTKNKTVWINFLSPLLLDQFCKFSKKSAKVYSSLLTFISNARFNFDEIETIFTTLSIQNIQKKTVWKKKRSNVGTTPEARDEFS